MPARIGAGLFAILLLGLFTRSGRTPSALAALIGGLAGYVVAERAGSAVPFLTSLAVAFAAYGLALPFGRERRG